MRKLIVPKQWKEVGNIHFIASNGQKQTTINVTYSRRMSVRLYPHRAIGVVYNWNTKIMVIMSLPYHMPKDMMHSFIFDETTALHPLQY
jgi:hypothetical protein